MKQIITVRLWGRSSDRGTQSFLFFRRFRVYSEQVDIDGALSDLPGLLPGIQRDVLIEVINLWTGKRRD